MDFCTQLRTATDAAHVGIEGLPLSQALAGGTVRRDEYADLLRRLLAAHQGWEPEAAGCAACGPVWSPDLARAAAIERDLSALGADPTSDPHPAVADWLAAVREQAAVCPAAWLGVLYVFEGSRMGSLALARPIAAALGIPVIPGSGLDYHLDGAADRVPRWLRFKATLNGLPLPAADRAAAAEAAVATFRMLHELYAATATAPVA